MEQEISVKIINYGATNIYGLFYISSWMYFIYI